MYQVLTGHYEITDFAFSIPLIQIHLVTSIKFYYRQKHAFPCKQHFLVRLCHNNEASLINKQQAYFCSRLGYLLFHKYKKRYSLQEACLLVSKRLQSTCVLTVCPELAIHDTKNTNSQLNCQQRTMLFLRVFYQRAVSKTLARASVFRGFSLGQVLPTLHLQPQGPSIATSGITAQPAYHSHSCASSSLNFATHAATKTIC